VTFDSDRLAYVTWTPPASANYVEAIVYWRRKPPPGAIGQFYGSGTASGPGVDYVVISGIPPPDSSGNDTWQFSIKSRNRVGLLSIPVTVEVTPSS